VDILITPGRAPPTLAHTRRTARPMVALALQPGPKTPTPQFTSSAARTGPLTMSRSATDAYPDTVEFYFRANLVHRIEWLYGPLAS